MTQQRTDIDSRVTLMSEVLKEAEKLAENLDERYREKAFPLILQGLLDGGFSSKVETVPSLGQKAEAVQQEKLARLSANLPVNSFFQKVNPETHVARFVCAAYYLRHAKQVEHFTIADILGIYASLRIKKPQNPTDTLNQSIRKAHIIDGPALNGQKIWILSADGEQYVEDLLNGSANTKKSAN